MCLRNATTCLFHESIGDGHSGELLSTPVSSLLAVSTESGDLGEVEVESLGEPVDGISGSVGQDLDEIVSSEFTSRFFGVGEAVFSAGVWRMRRSTTCVSRRTI